MARAKAAGLRIAVIAATALAVPPVEAQTQQRQYVNSKARTASANRPGARVTVAPRSFLDAGTEVLPGERKFTDYALPPAYFPLGAVTNTGGRVGWHPSPLPAFRSSEPQQSIRLVAARTGSSGIQGDQADVAAVSRQIHLALIDGRERFMCWSARQEFPRETVAENWISRESPPGPPVS